MKRRYTYIAALIFLILASYWRVITFTFWKDDWWLLWTAIHNIPGLTDWLHPGTPVEFMLFSRVFGTHAFLWHGVGIALHIGIALIFGKCIGLFTGRKRAGNIASLLYAGTVMGIDAVAWPSAHVVLWATLFLCTGVYYYLRNNTILALIYIALSLFVDPFRVFPILFLYPFLFLFGIPFLFTPLFRYHVFGSQLVSHFSLLSLFSHIHVIGNYFSSIAHLFFGWLVPFAEDASTGVYSRVSGLIGVGITIFTVFIVKRDRKLFTLLVWALVFYVPNWLFEPRLTMGITHRYMVIASVGCIGAFAYLFDKIKNKLVLFAALTFFVLANYLMIQRYIFNSLPYRLNIIWNTVTKETQTMKDPIVLSFTGDQKVKTYAVSLSGGYPLLLASDRTRLPIVTDDTIYIETLLCKLSFPLTHVFSWKIHADGSLTSTTLPFRKELVTSALAAGCVPVIDSAALEENR